MRVSLRVSVSTLAANEGYEGTEFRVVEALPEGRHAAATGAGTDYGAERLSAVANA
jgi:hypothetical protein